MVVKKHTKIVLVYGIVLSLMAIALLFVEKGQIVLLVNQNNNQVFDFFFKYCTYLGDGMFFVAFFILILLTKRKYALIVVGIGVVHGLIVSLFKRVLFSDAGRPITFFEDTSILHFVEGVSVHAHRSFPSGHTASAFALAVVLAFIYRKHVFLYVGLLAALLVAYSRMYILQHFYQDVVLGAVIGSLVSYVICMPYSKRLFSKE